MKLLPLICAGIVASLATAPAAPAPADAQAASNKLLSSITAGDYSAFIADGNPAFREIKKEMFDSVVAQLAPRFKTGYEAIYLGELKQEGYQVTLWKLSFKDGGDDALATLSLKDGKIGGYWIK